VNVVIVDQVFKRLFHLRRPFEPDSLQVVNLVYIFPPENTKQRADIFMVLNDLSEAFFDGFIPIAADFLKFVKYNKGLCLG
jgi:hypothetical protein